MKLKLIFFYCGSLLRFWDSFVTLLVFLILQIFSTIHGALKNGAILLKFYELIVYHQILKSEAFKNNKTIFSDLCFFLQN